jgi:hypothetical protein
VRVDTPGLLTNSDYSRFFIEWRNGHLKVKKNGSVLIEWQDPSPFGISHFGVRTAWGAQGHWRVKTVHPSAAPGIQQSNTALTFYSLLNLGINQYKLMSVFSVMVVMMV